jgi:hypothetical protein
MDEDFVNYKKPSMFLGFPTCSFKCCREGNFPIEVCQNCNLTKETNIEITEQQIVDRYLSNPITSAIVCGGLDPFDSVQDLISLIHCLRKKTNDDIVIYTGYTEEEIKNMHYTIHYSWGKQSYSYLGEIAKHPNIIIKYGRYRPNEEPHYDSVLGIRLASSNQYAVRIT